MLKSTKARHSRVGYQQIKSQATHEREYCINNILQK